MKKVITAILSISALGTYLSAEVSQPQARVSEVVDVLHGVEVRDPYRYMEDVKSPEVARWARTQADYTAAFFKKEGLSDPLYERLQEIESDSGPDVWNAVVVPSGNHYFIKREPDESLGKIYQAIKGEAPAMVLDPASLVKEKTVAIDHYRISPDEKYLACGISSGGTENATLYVIDLKTKQLIDNPIQRARWHGAIWLPDSSGFFYNQLQELEPDADRKETFKRSKVFLHRIGEASDALIIGHEVNPKTEIAPEHLPFVWAYPECEWAVAHVETGVSPNYGLYVAPVSEVTDSTAPWVKVTGMEDDTGGFYGNSFAIDGDTMFLLTRNNAPNGKIVKIDLKQPDFATATTVFAPERGVVEDLIWAKDAMYAKILAGGPSYLVRIPFDSPKNAERIPLPETGKVWPISTLSAGPRLEGVYFYFGTWTKPDLLYHYNPHTKETVDTKILPFHQPEICSQLIQEELEVESHDGVMVPLSIIYRKGVKKDGSNPVMLSGYGAYGISLQPRFRRSMAAFYEKGGIYAVAHVRGGGEFGKSWHQAGYKKTKPNTWKDFIACAEYLIHEKYTSSQHLCGTGRSAGGITIGRAITERPDLFARAIIGVGVCDAVRMETTPNGVPNIPEFGTVKIEEEFKALLEMSPYHHVRNEASYPAVLIVHGANDTRVELWQSLKMAASLQAATSSQKPVLLRIDYDSGHGRGGSSEQRRRLQADTYAFMLSN